MHGETKFNFLLGDAYKWHAVDPQARPIQKPPPFINKNYKINAWPGGLLEDLVRIISET